ncbi:MAG: K+/H+ antiporter subunit F [Tepidiphilus sp.]|jgi:multicomponent K+:H+ antiporter subunit F|nr:K+/H+ antiporter subunit F [Tepidiphilus sp.]MDD3433561.1 K+/H+ antiporter subunit F [Tepidiphilus sp.]
MIEWAALVALAAFGVGVLLCAWRLWRGPDLVDRAMALDTLMVNVIALIVTWGIWQGSSVLFEAALFFAMIGFVSTVAFCRYVLRGLIIE